jgi:hypothetical protein
MAGRGPAPKGAAQRRRRNKTPPVTVLVADGQVYGPELPDTHDWPPATVTWWRAWRTSAQASRFTETDWSFMLDTAVLHADFWLGDCSAAPELRLRLAKVGATPEDRARLRLQLGEPDGRPAPVARLRSKAGRRRLFTPPLPARPAR